MTAPRPAELLGVFESHDAFLTILEQAGSRKVTIREIFSPVPDHHAVERLAGRKSPIRYVTAAGGIAGLVAGIALALLTARVWNLVVGGKPVMSIVPVVVVGFELTILFGALATLAGLFFFGRLPFVRFPVDAYREEFSLDRFGIWLECEASQGDAIERWLRESGAVRVERIGRADAAEGIS